MKEYFKKFIECINLEQSAEKDRQSSSYNTNINKETDLQIMKVNSNGDKGLIVVLQKLIYDTKTSELGERTFVNLLTENNISFGKGFIVVRHYYFKEINIGEKTNGNEQAIDDLLDIQPVKDVVAHKKEFFSTKSKELQRNYQQHIEYVVEFQHLMPNNLSSLALGGRDPKNLAWTLELEPFSTFSYSVMRNNIFTLCVKDEYSKMRESIIYHQAPKNPSLEQVNDLHKRFKTELKVLNEEQQIAVLKSILA